MCHDQSDDILITRLSAEPKASEEINALTAKLALDRPKTDLIVDLGAVGEPSYQTLCRLITLCSFQSDLGCSCIFYNLSAATRRVFQLYGFDRIFQITEVSEIVFTPSPEQSGNGTLEFRSLNSTKPVERRKYVRLRIPSCLQVNVLFWLGGRNDDYHKLIPGHFWHGRLVDISEGGIQVAIDADEKTPPVKGQLIGLEFRPTPAEPLLIFDARIREVLPAADGKNICLGLQFTGLETNAEGRQGLRKLCNSDSTFYEPKENGIV
ncbi:MAG: PilZ domain-containing protein [Sedimentisphaerales bacterium]|nr:PilZ domain-containing protein [Sedimentisphaerales bacterium]